MFRTSFCAIALLASAAPAVAWTYREFTAGATIDEVGASLSAKGGSLERVSGVATSNATEVFVVQPASVPVLTFCHGRLSGYSDRIPGDIRGFLARSERESVTQSPTMPQFRLDIGKRNSFELTEAQWKMAPDVLLTLSWSAAGGSGIGLETVTQDCPETPPATVAEASPPPDAPAANPESEPTETAAQTPAATAPEPGASPAGATAAAEPPPQPEPPTVATTEPEPAQPARTAEAAQPAKGIDPDPPAEALAGTVHTPGVDIPADDAAAAASGQTAITAATPSDAGGSASPSGAASMPETPVPDQKPATIADSAAAARDSATTAQAAEPTSPPPAVQAAPPVPATPDVAVVVPLPPEAPVVIANAATASEPPPPSHDHQAVVVPPPPDVPAPFPESTAAPETVAGEDDGFPRVANVPLPPPRPAGLMARMAPAVAEPAAQPRVTPRAPAGTSGSEAPQAELPLVIVPGSQPATAPAATDESLRPPADVGSTAAVSAAPDAAAAEPAPSAGDAMQGDLQASTQPAPATTGTTSAAGRRWPPSTPEACAAAFRSYDLVTRTYKSHSGAVRPCP